MCSYVICILIHQYIYAYLYYYDYDYSYVKVYVYISSYIPAYLSVAATSRPPAA